MNIDKTVSSERSQGIK